MRLEPRDQYRDWRRDPKERWQDQNRDYGMGMRSGFEKLEKVGWTRPGEGEDGGG